MGREVVTGQSKDIDGSESQVSEYRDLWHQMLPPVRAPAALCLVTVIRFLPGSDRDVADLKALGRGHDLCGIEIGEAADGGRGEVIAVLGPGPVDLLHL